MDAYCDTDNETKQLREKHAGSVLDRFEVPFQVRYPWVLEPAFIEIAICAQGMQTSVAQQHRPLNKQTHWSNSRAAAVGDSLNTPHPRPSQPMKALQA
eukprot:2737802-Amphidinium_carterae.2